MFHSGFLQTIQFSPIPAKEKTKKENEIMFGKYVVKLAQM